MLAIQALRTLVVDKVTFASQLLMQLRATPGTVRICQFHQARLDGAILYSATQNTTLRSAGLTHHATGMPLA